MEYFWEDVLCCTVQKHHLLHLRLLSKTFLLLCDACDIRTLSQLMITFKRWKAHYKHAKMNERHILLF